MTMIADDDVLAPPHQQTTPTPATGWSSVPAPGDPRPVMVATDFFYALETVDDGEYVASEPQTGTYGEGDTPADAVISMLESMALLREELRSRGDQLAPELQADLRFLDHALWQG